MLTRITERGRQHFAGRSSKLETTDDDSSNKNGKNNAMSIEALPSYAYLSNEVLT